MAGRMNGFMTWMIFTLLFVVLFSCLHDVVENRWLRMALASVVTVAAALLFAIVQAAIRSRLHVRRE